MSIKFNPENKTFKLDTNTTSYVIQVNRYGYLMHHYYGALISDDALEYLNFAHRHSSHFPRVEMENADIPFFSKSVHRMEYSCNGCGDFRASALSILRDNGTADTDIKYVSHKIYSGKPKIEGQPATYANEDEATTLEITCIDSVSLDVLISLGTSFLAHEALASGCSEDCTTTIDCSADALGSEVLDLVIEKALPATIYTLDLPTA